MSRPLDPPQTFDRAIALINRIPDFGFFEIAKVCQSNCLTEDPALIQVVQFGGVGLVALMENWHKELVVGIFR